MATAFESPMENSDPKWRRFEQLVARIQADLAPAAIVRHNDKIEGRLTGVVRQVDVSIRQTVGPHDLLIVVDCKDLNRPADVKDVEEVIGLAQDVGANKAAIVSANGYTEAAQNRGRQAGLDLLRLVDTGQHSWRSIVTIPAVVLFTRLETFNFRLTSTEPKPWAIPSVDPRLIEVVDSTGQALGFLGDLLAEAWNEGRLPMSAGAHQEIPVIEQGYLMGPAGPVATRLTTNIRVTKTLYFGNLPLEEVSGFIDDTSGTLTTRGFTTAAIDILDVQKNWLVVPSLDALAIRPVFRLEASNYVPLLREAPIK